MLQSTHLSSIIIVWGGGFVDLLSNLDSKYSDRVNDRQKGQTCLEWTAGPQYKFPYEKEHSHRHNTGEKRLYEPGGNDFDHHQPLDHLEALGHDRHANCGFLLQFKHTHTTTKSASYLINYSVMVWCGLKCTTYQI